MPACLTLIRADQPVIQATVQSHRSYTIGRDAGCDVSVDDAEVSRFHALIECVDNQWIIRDTNSRNGLVVDGIPAKLCNLKNDAWIGLGSCAMRFEELTAKQFERSSNHRNNQRKLTNIGMQQIDESENLGEVLHRLMISARSISSAERSFIMLTRPDGDLEVACSYGADQKPLQNKAFIGSTSAVKMVLDTRKPVVSCDLSAHQALALKRSIIKAQTKALVCLPLIVFDRVVGVIYTDSQMVGKLYTELDLKLLSELSEHAALMIAAKQLNETIEQVDRQLAPISATRRHLATLQHRIPDFGQKIDSLPEPMSGGLRWNWIESQRH